MCAYKELHERIFAKFGGGLLDDLSKPMHVAMDVARLRVRHGGRP